MNWKLSSMTVAAFACAAITVAAQEPASPAGQAGRTAASADEQTFVGCIAAADTAAPGASKYVLKDAKKKESTSASSAPSASKPGAGAPAGTSGMSRTYQLDASDATITPEVGHQVEVVATIADSSAAGTAASPTASPSTSPSTSPSSASATPKLKVKTIKMIASKCGE